MTADPYAHRRFRLITTRAVRPSGRIVTSWNSYPRGVGKDVYDRIDADLVRLYGNENSRTVGYFLDENEGAVKSDRTRRDGLTPLPCIVCGKEMDSAANDPAFDHVPYAGTMFHSHGHYGSTLFDSFDGFSLQIVVCDECLKTRIGSGIRLVDPKRQMTMWDGETSDYEPGSPEYEAKMREQEDRLREAGVTLTDLSGNAAI